MPSPISPLNSYIPPTPSSPLSAETFHIAGILTTVFGLAEIPPDASEIVCLWLLHPRQDSQKDMVGLATAIVHDYYDRRKKSSANSKQKGFIAVAFDARNHGTREIDPMANQAWKSGNENHAPDMFSVYFGTAQDTSTLIDFLPAYIFPNSERSISGHFALGVSLGGHATWLCLLHEPRITAGVVVVGAPDFVALMADRARLSKLTSWLQGDAPGSGFLGSKHFPTGLLETVQKKDPAAVLSGQLDASKKIEFIRTGVYAHPADDDEGKAKTQSILDRHLRGKRILCLSGATDKLVPYRLFEPFMSWLKGIVTPAGGNGGDGDIYLEDIVFKNTAHELTEAMMQEVLRFMYDSVLALDRPNGAKVAKI
ncbi:hypothetical protein UA08_02079 [Talaromyces atroroseus]|uniref:AB hydrolase-1 domain-containing protein n=1 Tax=Talaromyces atroroseus TaxID=1441469 RepID=A0A1Q5QC06_TALAT|nr:hypothetical protein UA08_02079 [Talaromyces atroroseus]OKL63464.1 hypothetical protein UA08_02079 [Talaromyces atroroseus]